MRVQEKVLYSFMRKYFFILKAASEGWRVSYNGGNEFKFVTSECKKMELHEFLSRYTNTILLTQKCQ